MSRYRKHWFPMLSMLLIPMVAIFLAGCFHEEGDDNPVDDGGGGGGGGEPTTEEVLSEMETLIAPVDDIDECDALYLLQGDKSSDELMWLAFTVLLPALSDTTGTFDISDYYGTWEYDPVDSLVVMTGSASVLDLAIQGCDTLTQTLYDGSLQLSELGISADPDNETVTFDVAAALIVDGSGATASVDFQATIPAALFEEGGAGDEIPEMDITMESIICDFEAMTSLAVDATGNASMNGTFTDGDVTASYTVETDFDGADTCVTIELFAGSSSENTDMLISFTVCDDLVNCITGELYVDGTLFATFAADDCSAEEPQLTMFVDGVEVTDEEAIATIEELFSQLESLIGQAEGGLGGSKVAPHRSPIFDPALRIIGVHR